jgi:hypothetical protein
VKELEKMTSSISAPGYNWEIGRIARKRGPDIIYLLGYKELKNKEEANRTTAIIHPEEYKIAV